MMHNMYVSALNGHRDSVMFHILTPVKGISGEGIQVEKLVGKYHHILLYALFVELFVAIFVAMLDLTVLTVFYSILKRLQFACLGHAGRQGHQETL